MHVRKATGEEKSHRRNHEVDMGKTWRIVWLFDQTLETSRRWAVSLVGWVVLTIVNFRHHPPQSDLHI